MASETRGYAHAFRNPAFVNRTTGNPLPNDTGWQDRHVKAIRAAIGGANLDHEGSLVRMIDAWATYADAHAKRYESSIGADGVLGDEWEAMGRAIRALLNGETGRLDCGTLDAFLHDTLHAEGFDPDCGGRRK